MSFSIFFPKLCKRFLRESTESAVLAGFVYYRQASEGSGDVNRLREARDELMRKDDIINSLRQELRQSRRESVRLC